ncbi:Tat pathway signal sequence domain-containing protein 10 [Sesbania bispinosa]|nr:Tat pathway signal sequence domain-containing protein 10 [Sesbania bispinosa]
MRPVRSFSPIWWLITLSNSIFLSQFDSDLNTLKFQNPRTITHNWSASLTSVRHATGLPPSHRRTASNAARYVSFPAPVLRATTVLHRGNHDAAAVRGRLCCAVSSFRRSASFRHRVRVLTTSHGNSFWPPLFIPSSHPLLLSSLSFLSFPFSL